VKTCPVCGKEYADDVRFCAADGSTLHAKSPTADLVGQVVADRYHIIRKLGEGGMGAVYLGEHVKMGRKSAIKVMNPAMAGDPDAISRFNREAANASRISHPNVCQIYDFGETPDGTIYLAMEFIEGVSLTAIIEREGALPAARAAKILKQAADALASAHELGIVHRDLKPDNIMVVHGRDGADVVKVVDFGIAKAVAGDETGQKVTKTGLVVGTPEYMSPEQLSGDKLDGRSDIYSLGLVFYRMLTGVLPFQADSAQETMVKRLTDDPMPLAVARPDISFPPELQRVLDKALARLPTERYASAAQFGREAEAAVARLQVPQTRVGEPAHSAATQLMDSEVAVRGAPARRPAGPTATTRRRKVKRFPLVPVLGGVGGVGAIAVAAVIAMSRLGGKAQLGAVDTLARGDTAHPAAGAPDTSRSGAGGSTERPTGTRGGGATRQPTTHPATTPARDSAPRPPASAPDLAAIDRELNAAMDQALGDAPAAGRAAALRYYNMANLPDAVRGKAAEIVAQSYGVVNDTMNYRVWHERAAGLDPKFRMRTP
jgi:hypothetical protein